MTSSNIIHRFNTLPLGNIAHASVALTATMAAILIVLVISFTAINSIISGLNTLEERADTIAHLDEQLILRRQELENWLQLIGANMHEISIVASAQKTKNTLDNETTTFIEALENHGLSLISRSGLVETTVSPALSAYQSTIRLKADTNALAAFLSSDVGANGYIASMSINRNDADAGVSSFSIDIDLRRLGARQAPQEDGANE